MTSIDMQLIFNHKFGKEEKGEFFFYTAELINVDESEHDAALEQGFLLTVHNGKTRWFQNRSTRLDCTKYNVKVDLTFKPLYDLPRQEMDRIYTSYCVNKNYAVYFEVGESLPQDFFFGYYHKEKLVAWSKLRHYSLTCVEACQFAWDYANPELRIGIKSLHHEIMWAQEHGYKYVYLGPGYERSSIYKKDLAGFEWWTGREWSTDIEQYAFLCDRDSKLSSISDLYDI